MDQIKKVGRPRKNPNGLTLREAAKQAAKERRDNRPPKPVKKQRTSKSSTRPEDRKYHYTYKVTCLNDNHAGNIRIFYNIHSTDNLEDGFTGAGSALYESIKDHGKEAHVFERLQLHSTRKDAKLELANLRATQLINAKRPEDHKFHYVYKIVRFDGKFYIGVHSTNDMDDRYMGSGTYIKRSIKKYGRDQHTREILEMCESREQAFQREVSFVDSARKDPNCMNLGNGGQGGAYRVYGVTEETRRKCSEAAKAGWVQFKERGYSPPNQTERAKKKRAEANRGHKRTPEQLENLRAGQQKYHAENKEAVLERAARGAKTKSKPWKVTYPSGEEKIIKGLKELSDELCVSRSALYHAVNRKQQVNGITIERVNT